MKPLAALALLALAACAPMSQRSLAEKYPPVTHHVDGDLFEVYEHTSYWVRECHRIDSDVDAQYFEAPGVATFVSAPGPYFFYSVRMERAEQGGTDVAVSSAWDYMTRDFARWTRGETGCNPPGLGN